MTTRSMTAFARATGAQGAWRWSVELKCVNAKGLDVRLRCPGAFERIEPEARARIAKALARGTCFASFAATRENASVRARIDLEAFASLAAAAKDAAAKAGLPPPSADALLSMRGIVETIESGDDDAELERTAQTMLATLDEAIIALTKARRAEGDALGAILAGHLDQIARLTEAAEDCPGRKPEAVKARLAASVASLLEPGRTLDPNRLHQEAVLLAAKADVREELDRLKTHIAAVRAVLAETASVGRRLDFLAQELGREANTLCAKSNDAALTAIGLDLRVQIEQLREQVQNVE